MMRLIFTFFTFYLFPILLSSQVFFSDVIPVVFFGPDNVVIEDGANPVSIYIQEIEKGIDSLRKMERSNEITYEIKILQSIRGDWNSTFDSDEAIKKIDLVVTEFISLDDKLDSINSVTKSVPKNCLYSNPQDCMTYHLINKNEIAIVDDYGNEFIEGFHRFYNVGLMENLGTIKFYRVRNLKLQ
jgi:hypothetical protein